MNMAVKDLSDLRSDGARLGRSTADLIGFYGITTPIAQPAITAVGTTTATTTLNELRITRLYTALLNLNLIGTGG
jgi:hypothetical protein